LERWRRFRIRKEEKKNGGENVKNARKYAPCGAAKQFDAKQFDQTFSKFDAWFESMQGLSAEGGAVQIPKDKVRR